MIDRNFGRNLVVPFLVVEGGPFQLPVESDIEGLISQSIFKKGRLYIEAGLSLTCTKNEGI